jgi:meiotically up-regulated gene 157 (Mug157) protein
LYLTAYDETIQRHALAQRDGTTYVSTGDIDSEWLRDASAIVRPYIGLSQRDGDVRSTLRGVLARQAKYILIDPYANAFSRNYRVVERKFEVDSLLYPIWFAYDYYRQTGDRSVFTPTLKRAFDRVLTTLRTEQHHPSRSRYTSPQLANNGRGSAVRYTGMVWTGFRPSDDPVRYHYNIPVNMFASVVMKDLTTIARDVWHDDRMAQSAWGMSVEIQRGIEQFGTLELKPFGRIYAYEVDGMGHANVMDDANVPSLLSIPYFGYLPRTNSLYMATRRLALSDRNPYFFQGKYAQGIGSPHTPHGYVWPLALCVQALTATDEREVSRVFGWIAASDVGDHRLHESFNANWPEAYTREDFAWPNALYAELVLTRRGQLYAVK